MRSMPAALDDLASGEGGQRAPAFRVEIYDLRSSTSGNTINDIVQGNGLDAVVGPANFSNFIELLDVTEQAGDYATGSITSTVATVTVQDPDGRFDPMNIIDDATDDTRYFRRGNVVRVYEGDESVDSSQWVLTYTLEIQGQPGYSRSRATGNSVLTFRATSREASFLGFTRVSREFTSGETYLTIGQSIAQNEMGLDLTELDFSGWGTRTLRHATMTLADEPPILMLSRVMFADGFLPKFASDGKLTQTLIDTNGAVNRFYTNKNVHITIDQPLADIRAADSVCVVGLDYQLARVDQPRQVLAETSLTTGYFTQNEEIDIFFSDDHTVLAENPQLIVVRSVNGGLTSLGGGESFTPIPAPNSQQEGYIGIKLTISTGYAPWLSVFLLVTYAILAAVPDLVIVVGFIASSGTTINVGGIAQAVALSAAMIIMTALGRGIYEVEGDPFEYVFPEIRRCARLEGVGEFSKNEIVVTNHLIDDASTADDRAREIFFQQQASLHPRNIAMLPDIALEPNDIFVTLDDERRFLVRAIRRSISRNDEQSTASLLAWELTAGIENVG